MKRLFFLVVLLIVHGSLYPWRFHSVPAGPNPLLILLHSWPPVHVNRFLLRDTSVNVLLYLPLGICGYLWLARSGSRWRAAAVIFLIALILSSGIETLQVYAPGRNSSLLDVLCNVTGAAFGVCAGVALRKRRIGTGGGRKISAAPLLLACIWTGYLLYPFFPAFSRTWLLVKWSHLMAAGYGSWIEVLVSAAEWFAVGRLVQAGAGPEQARRIFPLLLLLIPGKLLLAGRTFTWPEITGAAGAWALWFKTDRNRTTAVAAVVFSGILLLRGLYPFHLSTTPAAFQWVPFAPFLHTNWSFGFPLLLRKAFDYGAAVWLFRAAGVGLAPAGALVAAYLAGVEAIQVFLPGHTPEITDPLLALLMTFILSVAERY